MTQFVGAEYIIANMLIKKCKNGQEMVSLAEISKCGIEVQRILVEENIDAVFFTSRDEIYHAIYDFTDYFTCQYDDGQIVGIKINPTKQIGDLETRFVGSVPETIVEAMTKAIDLVAA